jgi:hypothetical protein
VVRTDDKAGQSVSIDYREAKEFKGHAAALSSGARKAVVGTVMAVGITVGVVGLFLLAIHNRT